MYRFHLNCVTPNPGNRAVLHDLRHGNYDTKTFLVEPENYDLMYGPHDMAKEHKRELELGGYLQRWIERRLVYIEIITVQVRFEYNVVAWLTDNERCLDTLNRDMLFNVTSMQPDIPETIEFYEAQLQHQTILDGLFKTVAKLPSPEFDGLISGYVMRKLQSEQVPGRPDLWQISP